MVVLSLSDCVVDGWKKVLSDVKNQISSRLIGHVFLMVFAVVVLVLLQHQYWYGEFGNQSLSKLTYEIQEQQRFNASQQATNDMLRADIQDLKSGLNAIEEHARLDFSLIKPNEIFVQMSTSSVVDSSGSSKKAQADDVIEPTQEFESEISADKPE